MRIAYILTSLGMGGAERQVVALAARMEARGHAVCLLILLPRQAEEWLTHAPVHYLGIAKNPLSLLAGLARGHRILGDFRPDLVHSHTYAANIAARLVHVLHRAPVVSTVHNIYEGRWPRMLAYRLTDPLSRRTTAVSQAAAQRYVRLKAVPSHKCLALANGIDTAEFAPDPSRRARIRAELAAGDEFLWLAAGRIAPAKDYPNLLRAFRRVRAEVPAAQLWVSGEAGAAALAPLQDLARKLGLEGSVRWLGLRRDMPALLDAADGFVLASAWEGLPLALGEAMAMEKPVVATDVGGVRELVGDSGSIVAAANPEALARAMVEAMRATPEARAAQGRAARQRIAEHFGIDRKADQWEALYRGVLEGR